MARGIHLVALVTVFFANVALASGGHEGHGATHSATPTGLALAFTPGTSIAKGTTSHITLTLTQNGKPVTLAMLKQVHTRKLHLLIVDPTLTDYHHLHPEAGKNPGEYVFDFTPRTDHGYRVWADVTLAKSGAHDYVMADLGAPASDAPTIDKTTHTSADVAGYHFALTFDQAPKAGEMAMMNIAVTKDGKPFNALEPVMGAFAHVVGFGEDYRSVLHIHPMGEEPTNMSQRGGPELMLHLAPEKPGFVKLFAQFRINGKDIFVPFGVMVRE